VILKLITGGQRGADLGALLAARGCGVPTGGFAPRGYKTEAGPDPGLAAFGLVEHASPDYPPRTAANVATAAACLWFGRPHSPGGKLTLRLCLAAGVPVLVVRFPATPADVAAWVRAHADGKVLMVAGNRESTAPGIGAATRETVAAVLTLLKRRSVA
jgi:hypothetical protein